MLTAYSVEELTDPPDRLLARRNLLPLSRLNDTDILSMDFERWAQMPRRFSLGDDSFTVQMLTHRIRRDGFSSRIDIRYDHAHSISVANGHHRIYTLKSLGCTHVPYRWFVPAEQSFYSDNITYRRGHLPR